MPPRIVSTKEKEKDATNAVDSTAPQAETPLEKEVREASMAEEFNNQEAQEHEKSSTGTPSTPGVIGADSEIPTSTSIPSTEKTEEVSQEKKKPRVVETKEGEDYSLIINKRLEDSTEEKEKPPMQPQEIRGPDWAAKKREQASVDIEAIKNEIEARKLNEGPLAKAKRWFDHAFK